MKIGVITFPGTNCDQDVVKMVQAHGHTVIPLWHKDRFETSAVDMAIVPGGFSYGDYLRCGALAARSPVMHSVRELASKGKPVLGICNGFQILCETGLLPGVLVRNDHGQFTDKWTEIELVQTTRFFAQSGKTRLRLPVAHGEGRFYADKAELDKIEDQGLVWFRYTENINGSLNNIAGVMNKQKNVAALMPHPERAMFEWMGGNDGFKFI
ncbi:MAG: phosphoribosylformylglycinamidine synthase subunit PurQ [Bdellovibrionaceae bacterium]|nr:phosphoribosylformylglycinamidine synthase subunit PurQ [Pseudobdellovibrionaceae bacterium]